MRKRACGLVSIAAALSLGACTHDFDVFTSTAADGSTQADANTTEDGAVNTPDASVLDSASGPDGEPDVNAPMTDSATADAPVDATPVDGAPPSEAGACAACVSAAMSCAMQCRMDEQTCSTQCSSNSCRQMCRTTEMQCKMMCNDTCNACAGSSGCQEMPQCMFATM